MTLLNISKIGKQIENNWVVKDVSFTQTRYQKIVVAGETGSGKSTLLKMIGGLVQPDAGSILFDNKNVDGPDEKLVAGHSSIAYLSQHFELPKFLRVEQVLRYVNSLSNKEANSIYTICQINHLLQRKTDQLSGGEKQRIAIARLLISKPKLLLLDEPFSNLDMVLKDILKSVIDNIMEKLRITCMLVSHDPADSLSWADEILVMKEGKVIQSGSPEEIYRNPINEYVAGLFGTYNVLTPTMLKFLKVSPKKAKRIVRPEEMSIKKLKTKSKTSGKVTDIHFLGSHYEIEVMYNKKRFIVASMKNSFQIDDFVVFTLSK
ncbi:MAG TPA: ABC transporter ATP-binding protein [Chryseolinea sp.]|nr:ABC transporter ATP-binding protein [Chryseolinea sp.]HPM32373.1 ABC transporter ATP-binding protein [Chryseolinea sp.]